jgi:GNAT superfamily N-acetyltransferase
MESATNNQDFLQNGYTLSTDNSLLPFEVIYDFLLNESYWSQGISAEKLHNAINNSLCFAIYHQHNLCAFARVITDKATFGYICDVFVRKPYRGKGLSKWLMQNIKQHPELNSLRRWSLATADAHGLYGQYGFTPLSKPEYWMEIFTPYICPTEVQR